MDKIIVVDKNDNQIGLEEKIKCHLGKGILHRAFTILVFNNRGEVLIQKRSPDKMLWPLVWETSCSSHPPEGETFQGAGQKRLKEELGFACPLKLVDKFIYRAEYKNVGSENEVCALLTGNYNDKVKPNPKQVADWKWIGLAELHRDIKKNPEQYTPWLKIALEKVESYF